MPSSIQDYYDSMRGYTGRRALDEAINTYTHGGCFRTFADRITEIRTSMSIEQICKQLVTLHRKRTDRDNSFSRLMYVLASRNDTEFSPIINRLGKENSVDFNCTDTTGDRYTYGNTGSSTTGNMAGAGSGGWAASTPTDRAMPSRVIPSREPNSGSLLARKITSFNSMAAKDASSLARELAGVPEDVRVQASASVDKIIERVFRRLYEKSYPVYVPSTTGPKDVVRLPLAFKSSGRTAMHVHEGAHDDESDDDSDEDHGPKSVRLGSIYYLKDGKNYPINWTAFEEYKCKNPDGAVKSHANVTYTDNSGTHPVDFTDQNCYFKVSLTTTGRTMGFRHFHGFTETSRGDVKRLKEKDRPNTGDTYSYYQYRNAIRLHRGLYQHHAMIKSTGEIGRMARAQAMRFGFERVAYLDGSHQLFVAEVTHEPSFKDDPSAHSKSSLALASASMPASAPPPPTAPAAPARPPASVLRLEMSDLDPKGMP